MHGSCVHRIMRTAWLSTQHTPEVGGRDVLRNKMNDFQRHSTTSDTVFYVLPAVAHCMTWALGEFTLESFPILRDSLVKTWGNGALHAEEVHVYQRLQADLRTEKITLTARWAHPCPASGAFVQTFWLE